MAEALKRPGGELASRPLHFFWVVDCSGSMYGEKIGTVNHAIQSTIPEMVDAAKDNPNAQLLVRTLKFSTGATWVTPDPVNIEDFAWDDLDAGGVTDLGKAFEMLAAQLTIPPMTDRALPPSLCCSRTDSQQMTIRNLWISCCTCLGARKLFVSRSLSVRMRMTMYSSSLLATASLSCRRTIRRHSLR